MAKRTKSQQKKTKRQSIPRQTRKFQLRKDHAIDNHVAEILDFKRSKRAEVTTIRDGVRLLWALENGDLAVLFEMFPQYRTQFTPGGAGGGDDLQQIKSMLEIVVAGRKSNELLMQSAAAPASEPPAKGTGLKQIKAPNLDLPVFEDDDELPTVIVKQAAMSDSAMNFVKAMNGLV